MATGLQLAHNNVLSEGLKQGLQSFVPQFPAAASAPSLTATATTGTPAPGMFYSTIVGRSPIPDITKDLRASMGVERIVTQQIAQLQTEFGPNGELVYSAVNDDRGLIRYVGSGWAVVNDVNGVRPQTSTIGDFLEVTFFGTGLNLLTLLGTSGTTLTVTVDGNASASISTVASQVLNTRNYSPNQILSVVSALSLGLHTVRISIPSGSYFAVSGVEIIGSVSNINVNPGSAYVDLAKTSLLTQQSLSYNSGFESGTLGTRGGHVVVYQKADGTIGKAVQPVNASTAFLASADHTNEEVARTYFSREFGAGRSDDFSRLSGSQSAVFTLDDGTTTLVGSNVRTSQSAISAGPESIGVGSQNGFMTLIFVGTGLDVEYFDNGNSRQYTVTVDNVAAGTVTSTANSITKTVKIVSGLAYGTHVVRFTNPNTFDGFYFTKFIVYQPKKPSIPSGAIELADYNVMATYIANTTSGAETLGTGILRKLNVREMTYSGTWTAGLSANDLGGYNVTSSTVGDYTQYTLFGTGFDFRCTGSTATFQITVDGVTNLSGFNTSSYGTASLTASTGQFSVTGGVGNGVSVSGLSLSTHTVRIARVSGAGGVSTQALDIITPVHSAKSALYADIQNTLSVGSCSISDNRATTLLKDKSVQSKPWVQAVGITNSPTTTSTSYVPCPDMSVIIKTNGGALDLAAQAVFFTSVANTNVGVQFYVDGLPVGTNIAGQTVTANNSVFTLSPVASVQVAPGVHKVDLYWVVSGGATAYAQGTTRLIKAREV